ncbi:DoxX family protein [Nesterenkonia sphaerica]|uniref:DoxX family protein n=1 Tax=Nesterenkonia sphaerica TaxID=1804988 RepID=A0A5R9AD21_9MICC|nr:DoxX family protein [Nesterenkonia sphaerica]TLP75746.1 DoxX family protein [Nesterenkonia sphaerica]
MQKTALTNTGLTVLRIVLGFLFTAHGWRKFNEWTIDGTQAAFGEMGIPLAQTTAPMVATLELVGGIALILGLLSRPVAVLLSVIMLTALVMVHLSAGIFVEAGGVELVLLLGAGAAAVALAGPGKLSLDYAMFSRRDSKLAVLA